MTDQEKDQQVRALVQQNQDLKTLLGEAQLAIRYMDQQIAQLRAELEKANASPSNVVPMAPAEA